MWYVRYVKHVRCACVCVVTRDGHWDRALYAKGDMGVGFRALY